MGKWHLKTEQICLLSAFSFTLAYFYGKTLFLKLLCIPAIREQVGVEFGLTFWS